MQRQRRGIELHWVWVMNPDAKDLRINGENRRKCMCMAPSSAMAAAEHPFLQHSQMDQEGPGRLIYCNIVKTGDFAVGQVQLDCPKQKTFTAWFVRQRLGGMIASATAGAARAKYVHLTARAKFCDPEAKGRPQ